MRYNGNGNRNRHNDTGTLTAYTGPMYAGKTTALIDALDEYETYAAFKPAIDDRYDETQIVTHDDTGVDAYVINSQDEFLSAMGRIRAEDPEPTVIGIDEAQFFDDTLPATIDILQAHGYDVVVAGLDKDFRRDPFSPVPDLIKNADTHEALYADCNVEDCSDPAPYTQRLIDGKPAEHDSPQVLVGGTDTYEPRCEVHHIVRYRR